MHDRQPVIADLGSDRRNAGEQVTIGFQAGMFMDVIVDIAPYASYYALRGLP
jgi:hypothetical protein